MSLILSGFSVNKNGNIENDKQCNKENMGEKGV